MRITPPFTVILSDASQPPQSVSVDLRITIIAKPPEITVSAAECLRAGLACSVTVATATGGTPPYYFTNGGFGSGTPPLGMIVDLKGVLKGKPAKAGAYTFGVCVVDLVGATDCATAKGDYRGGVARRPVPRLLARAIFRRDSPTNLPRGHLPHLVVYEHPQRGGHVHRRWDIRVQQRERQRPCPGAHTSG